MDKIKSICFTGHRQLSEKESSELFSKLLKILQVLAERGLSFCHVGGALGFDTIASLAVLETKRIHPDVKLNLILPCLGQEASWSPKQQTVYAEIKSRADSVRTLSPYFYNGCMQKRNKELLENSDLCVAYLRPGTRSGGSLNTVLQAAKMNIPIINLAETESEDLLYEISE